MKLSPSNQTKRTVYNYNKGDFAALREFIESVAVD
jgi:hypothetical protein